MDRRLERVIDLRGQEEQSLAGWRADELTAEALRAAIAAQRAAISLETAPEHHPTRWPRTVRALDALHAARRHPVIVAVDLPVIVAAGLLAGLSPLVALVGSLVLAVAAYVGGVYQFRDSVQTQGVLWYPGVLLPSLTATTLVAGAVGVSPPARLAVAAGLTLALLTAMRGLSWLLLAHFRRQGTGLRATLLVGDEVACEGLRRKLLQFPEAGLLVVGWLPASILCAPGRLSLAVVEHAAEHVVVIPQGSDQESLAASLRRCDQLPTTLSMVPPMADVFLASRHVSEVGGVPLLPLGRALHGRTTFPGKRAFDVVAAALLLLLVAPIIGLAALLIRLEDGGPTFFRQVRTGHHGRSFRMVKLRSMQVGAEDHLVSLRPDNVTDGLLFKLDRDPRVTRVGALLRRTAVDELPQLWNVLRGDMSLVGPRPLAVRAEEFRPGDAGRHAVLPGITGYWQISGGNGLSYDEMVRLDLAYVHSWSLWLDIRLLLRTPAALLNRKGPS